MAVGHSDKVTKLPSDKGISSSPQEQNKYVISANRSSRRYAPFRSKSGTRHDDGGIVRHTAYSLWSKTFIIIFCVLFSSLSVPPAWAQETEGLNTIEPLRIGDEIPDSLWHYKMPLYKGVDIIDSLSLSDFSKDEEVLIIDFWPYWCSPCIKSVLHLDSLTKAKQYQNIKFISINVIEPESRYLKFVNQSGFDVPTLYDFSFLVNRLLTRYMGYYGVLMIKGRKILGAPDVRTLTEDNLDKIEKGEWSERTLVYWPERSRFEFARDFGKGGKP